jgi:hypothetical protein
MAAADDDGILDDAVVSKRVKRGELVPFRPGIAAVRPDKLAELRAKVAGWSAPKLNKDREVIPR